MIKVLAQANKEWMEFKRDRLSFSLAFLLPIFSLLLFSYGIRLQSQSVPLLVQDHDGTALSREYISRLLATNEFSLAHLRADRNRDPQSAIDDGAAKVAVIVPAGFSANVLKHERVPVQVLIDGTDIANSQIVSDTIKSANLFFLETLAKEKYNRDGRVITPDLRVWFNPGRSEPLFLVPGVFGVVIWMYPCLLSAVAASREKEQGTVVRVYAAKLSALDWIFGKSLVYFLIGMCIAVLVIGLGCLLFKIVPAGDPTPLLVGTPLFVLSSVLFGLFLGIQANSQTTAVQATSTGGFFPCLLLSGFVYPITNIPFPLSLFSIIVPARYYIEISRDTFVRGAGWAVGSNILILALFISVFLLASWSGARRMQFNA